MECASFCATLGEHDAFIVVSVRLPPLIHNNRMLLSLTAICFNILVKFVYYCCFTLAKLAKCQTMVIRRLAPDLLIDREAPISNQYSSLMGMDP